jgi:class 3 adenylate cyclase
MDDVRAVLDAARSTSAAVFAQGQASPLAIVFAATHPERVRSLILYSPVAKIGLKADDYPWGSTEEELAAWREYSRNGWGTPEFAREWLRRLAPSADGDPQQIAWQARLMRASATPSAAARFMEMGTSTDVRDLLPAVHVPTLVLVRRDSVTPKGGVDVSAVDEATYIAERIPSAELALVPGRDYLPWIGDQEALISEVAAFAKGTRQRAERDRVLLTVLFTDIIDSTGHLARVGDSGWRELLAEHDAAVTREIERFRGRKVDQAGDGVFATFDGPARAVNCAQAIVDDVQRLGLGLRAGVHTGECELDGDRVTGIAVHTGARIAAAAEAGEVLVSNTVRDLVAGSGLRFSERGAAVLKGIPGEWRLYKVEW